MVVLEKINTNLISTSDNKIQLKRLLDGTEKSNDSILKSKIPVVKSSITISNLITKRVVSYSDSENSNDSLDLYNDVRTVVEFVLQKIESEFYFK